MVIDHGAVVHLTRAKITGEIHFAVRPAQLPATVYVAAGCEVAPSAISIDLEPSGWPSALNTSTPLMCGHFDCQLVQSRGRFAMVDTSGGFYLFRGFCQEDCFVLTAVFTPYTTAGVDPVMVAMVASIGGVVSLVVMLAIEFSCYLCRRRRRQLAEVEGSVLILTYA
jgi:hypothetical protein